MSLRDRPHYEIPAEELAAWIERQGDQWWSLDNEPILRGLFIPCTGHAVAAALRRVGKPLLVEDRRKPPVGKGEVIDAHRLDELAAPYLPDARPDDPRWTQDRAFTFTWKGSDTEWLLIEDTLTADSERAEAALAEGKG